MISKIQTNDSRRLYTITSISESRKAGFLDFDDIVIIMSVKGESMFLPENLSAPKWILSTRHAGVVLNSHGFSQWSSIDKQIERLMIKVSAALVRKTLSSMRLEDISEQRQHLNCIPIPKKLEMKLLRDSLIEYSKRSSFPAELLELKLLEFFLVLAHESTEDFKKFFYCYLNEDKMSMDSVINRYYTSNLTLDQLAVLAGFSTSTFKRKFVNEYNCTPHKWIQNMRLNEARFLLTTSSKTISEIGFKIGYENISHFIQAFKMKFGITPKSFRNKLATSPN